MHPFPVLLTVDGHGELGMQVQVPHRCVHAHCTTYYQQGLLHMHLVLRKESEVIRFSSHEECSSVVVCFSNWSRDSMIDN